MATKNIATKKGSDIAKNTILVLLILTIVLSAISTWVVLDTINQVRQQYLSVPSVQKGYISVTVLPRPGEQIPSAGNTVSKITGGVSFAIIKPEK